MNDENKIYDEKKKYNTYRKTLTLTLRKYYSSKKITSVYEMSANILSTII